jgi:hypothetical protein
MYDHGQKRINPHRVSVRSIRIATLLLARRKTPRRAFYRGFQQRPTGPRERMVVDL